jgi:hypothetical protein
MLIIQLFEMFSKNSVFYEFNRIVSIISIILYSTGIIGNILSISICLRKKLIMVPTFIFMASISILNIIKLFTIFTCVLNKKIKEEFQRTSSFRLSLRLSKRQNSSFDNSKLKRKSSASNVMSNYISNLCTSNSVGYNPYKSRKSFSNTTNGQHSVRPPMVNSYIFFYNRAFTNIYKVFPLSACLRHFKTH